MDFVSGTSCNRSWMRNFACQKNRGKKTVSVDSDTFMDAFLYMRTVPDMPGETGFGLSDTERGSTKKRR